MEEVTVDSNEYFKKLEQNLQFAIEKTRGSDDPRNAEINSNLQQALTNIQRLQEILDQRQAAQVAQA